MAETPYRIATLCYLFDDRGRLLLIHRRKHPNRDLYSPIGGKLDTVSGESPQQCALREIREETGLVLSEGDLHLVGLVSETAYQNETHWLMFLYEVTTLHSLAERDINEGRLAWVTREELVELPMPETDREVIWPLFWAHRGGFFAAHIDCRGGAMRWTLDRSLRAEGGVGADSCDC
ncbi:NUDIX hydrolase [Mucisphaera calidilacus]|uniref:8-oxo-dGTP diphosphatase n=1 Tax=Mucisphaera calidilacus TaxID=2527982 RepID=A0A518C1C1_9BACT|nr:NUDIX domain-containing protein [Mucisphaera calidilacus]QDU73026.1 8-oxo-dGTP diphosphatase [Mucisphaera calidilacus]